MKVVTDYLCDNENDSVKRGNDNARERGKGILSDEFTLAQLGRLVTR